MYALDAKKMVEFENEMNKWHSNNYLNIFVQLDRWTRKLNEEEEEEEKNRNGF